MARRRAVAALFGDASWATRLEDGSDAGYFGIGSATWAVHGGTWAALAGIRALLLQSVHPAAAAGIAAHSRNAADPFGRLANTTRWVYTVTHGDTTAAAEASARVREAHRHVHGSYTHRTGELRTYSAADPELLRWVHLAFTDSFLATAQVWGEPIPGGADRYINEWAVAAELLGLPNPPRSLADLREQMRGHRVRGDLLATEHTFEVIKFLRRPPLSPHLRFGYRGLLAGAIRSLHPDDRTTLRLTTRVPPIVTSISLRALAAATGGRAWSEAPAIRRNNGLIS